MTRKPVSSQGSSYTSRRTYLINRLAGGILLFAVLLIFFGGDERSWSLIIGMAALAVALWVLAARLEKGRSLKNRRETDEKGNVTPKKL